MKRFGLGLVVVLAMSACSSGSSSAPSTPDESPASTPTPSVAASPSGASGPWVVFRSLAPDGHDGIFLARMDGSDRHQLVVDLPFVQAAPAWSPDGAQIAFVARDPDEALWIVDANDSNAHEIVPATAGCCGQDKPDWSPDGKTIAFVRWLGPENDITTQIMLYDVATGDLSVAYTAKSPIVLDRPRWSPDGARLAVDVTTMTPDGSAFESGAIGLIDLPSGALDVITDADHFFGYPSWDPTGTSLVFESEGLTYWDDTPAGKATDLWAIDVDGTDLRQITHNDVGGLRATQPFWLTDGSICYIEAEAVKSHDTFLRCLAADFTPLTDPAIPIQGTHPRFQEMP